jgi:methylmalonyl-CoA mutase N-terminal domain/subunit
MELIEQSDALGGSEEAIAAGFFQEEIARSAYEHQLRVESGATTVVGVNRFTDMAGPPAIPAPDYSALEKDQTAAVSVLRSKRDAARAAGAIAQLEESAVSLMGKSRDTSPIMTHIVDAVRARCTVGEISTALEKHWGRYTSRAT